jgi:hypothetical protein
MAPRTAPLTDRSANVHSASVRSRCRDRAKAIRMAEVTITVGSDIAASSAVAPVSPVRGRVPAEQHIGSALRILRSALRASST